MAIIFPKTLRAPMKPYRANYNRVIFFTCFAIVMIVVGIECIQFFTEKKWILEDLHSRLKEHTVSLDMKAQTIRDYTQGLKITAENKIYYQNHKHDYSHHFKDLRQNQDGTYSLDVTSPVVKKDMVGNLTGIGHIDEMSEALQKEIKMALSLNTAFELALKNNPGVVWVYYTSKSQFQNLYPWLPSSNISYYDQIIKRPFFTKGLPQNNPLRKNYWTEIYRDAQDESHLYQKGFVVTNAAPVYDGDQFLGIVAIDLSLSELERLLNNLTLSQGGSILVNEDDQILAMQGFGDNQNKNILTIQDMIPEKIKDQFMTAFRTPQAKVIPLDNYYIYIYQLSAAPWRLVYIVPSWDLLNVALLHAFEDIIIIAFVMILVIGLGYFIVMRDFISPAEKLLIHLERENKGLPPIHQDVPERWKAWFEIISHIFAENRTLLNNLEQRVKSRTQQLQEKNRELEQALQDLKKAQNQIIVQEKLASLGSLTAGIAHEIKNPLNFILNFIDLSLDYLNELKGLNPEEQELVTLILSNIEKVKEHAHRADSIVKSMLFHANSQPGQFENANLNTILDKALELALSGFQTETRGFSVRIQKLYDPELPEIKVSVGDISRVFLNLFNNACFAMAERLKDDPTFKPQLQIETQVLENALEVVVEDNGTGMPQEVIQKIFTPFFTTKDPGKGTGLGLSLSYDIIVQQHHGKLDVTSEVGQFTGFVIQLPL